MTTKIACFLTLVVLSLNSWGQTFNFDSAYDEVSIPEGILETVSWVRTRQRHLLNEPGSCMGLPQAIGVMGLFENGENYFIENAHLVETVSGISISEQKASPNAQIQAYAVAFDHFYNHPKVAHLSQDERTYGALLKLSEIPDTGNVNILARDMQVYEIMSLLQENSFAASHGFPVWNSDLISVFGDENLKVLSAQKIKIEPSGVTNDKGDSYHVQSKSIEYGPAIWNPAPTCNFSSRNGVAVSAITIHTIQGSYAGAISWSQNCVSNVSFHYVIRSSDGQVTQMVLEADKGWHVGSENPYTIGYEHEGYVDDPVWYTPAMYNSSADLSRDIVNSGYGIPPLRTYYGASSVTTELLGGCTKIKGHQHYPNQTHTDPGINWDWEHYYRLINNNPTITPLTSPSGTLTDSGGSGGDYQDDERLLWLIEPANAQQITLDFQSFDLELDYDYLFIYDGDSLDDPLIGPFTGTSSPGVITSSGGSLLIEFRSDCGTVAPGWVANYSSVQSDVNPPTTLVQNNLDWKTDDFLVDFIDSDSESGVNQRFYSIAHNEPGSSYLSADSTSMFAYEDFSLDRDSWTDQTGTFALANGALEFNDAANQNSNAYLLIDQNANQGILYEWDMNFTSNDPSQRGGMHFFCDDPTLPNRGNSYFVYLREDDDKMQIYRVTNDVFNLESDVSVMINEGTVHNCKVYFDPTSGLIQTYLDNDLVSQWTDPNPLTTGNSISLRCAGTTASFDNIHVYLERSTQIQAFAGLVDDLNIESVSAQPTGQIISLVNDNVGLWSDVDTSGFLLDFTPPTVNYLHDGIGADIDTFFTSTIESNWDIVDLHSSIDYFEYAIGTLPNLDDVVGWTGNGLNYSLSEVLSAPIIDQVYHISVRATNQAGLNSNFISNGQRYVPNVGISSTQLININVYPNPSTGSFKIESELPLSEVLIYDMSGALVKSINQPDSGIFISDMAKGQYKIVCRSQQSFVVKQIIIQ